MPNTIDQRIHDLIGSFYDTAEKADPEAWGDVFLEMADIVSSGPGALSFYIEQDEQFGVMTGTMGPEFLQAYNDYFHTVNPVHEYVVDMQPGDRLNRQEITTDDEYLSSEIYRDYYSTLDIFHWEYQVFTREKGTLGGFTFTRGQSQPNFSDRDLEVMKVFNMHLQRAFNLYQSVVGIRRESKILSIAFDRIPRGIFVVDRDHKLVFSNQHGEFLLKNGDGLAKGGNNKLRAASQGDGRHLRSVLDGVFAAASAGEISHGGILQLARRDGGRPLQVMVTPFSDRHFSGDRDEHFALLFVSDPDQKAGTDDEILIKMFGLTPAEARVARLLADGRSIAKICKELKIADNTARTHLKHIFSKTDTHRQSELLTLISKLPTSLEHGNR